MANAMYGFYNVRVNSWTLLSNDRGFFALLRCPIASGIVRMLTDHCKTRVLSL